MGATEATLETARECIMIYELASPAACTRNAIGQLLYSLAPYR